VVLHWRKGVGHSGEARPSTTGPDAPSIPAGSRTFASTPSVSEDRVTPIPKDVPFDIAALMGCAVTTALGLINNLAQLKIGPVHRIMGCGGVWTERGSGSRDGGRASRSSPSTSTTTAGMARPIRRHPHDQRQQVRLSGRSPQDRRLAKEWMCSSKTTGIVGLIEAAYETTGVPKGRTVLVGVPRQRSEHQIFHSLPLHHGKVLTGCEGGDTKSDVGHSSLYSPSTRPAS